MDARRFTTPEIEEVFARAAASQQRARDADLGLTVEELQAVGAEAGLDPVHVAAAARAVASGEPEEGRESVVGVPVGVHRAATLSAPPSDALWEPVVADLRDTFAARGKTERIGESRIWRNGNLRATLSPSGDGARLRLQTNRRKDTQGLLTVAAVQAVMAAVFSLDALGRDPGTTLFLALMAAALFGFALVRQVTWVRARERQMDDVAARAQRLAQALAPETTGGASETTSEVAPRLDLLRLDDDDTTTETSRTGRRTRA